MSEKMISRRGAFSLLGLAALGFAVPTTVLTTSDAEAQAQPIAPAPTTPAPTTAAPGTQPMSGMERREERRAARRTGREERREARRTGREERRDAPLARSDVKRGEPLASSDVRRGADCTCGPPSP